MNENKKILKPDLRFILRGLLSWLTAASALLLVSAAVFSRTNLGSEYMGYISSAISFLSAMAAGFSVSRGVQQGYFYRALTEAFLITILLLTLGFAVKGSELKASSVLSVVSFTFSGLLSAAVMSPIIFSGKRKRKPDLGRR